MMTNSEPNITIKRNKSQKCKFFSVTKHFTTKFVTGVDSKATGKSKVNDSPVKDLGVHKEFAQDIV